MKVNGKDCPIYEMEKNMFETTNQNNKVIVMPKCSMVTLMVTLMVLWWYFNGDFHGILEGI